MKSLLAIIFLAAVLFGAWWLFFKTDSSPHSMPKQESIQVGKHTPAFNESVSNSVNAYLDMKSAFVEADTFSVKKETQKFIGMMDSVRLNDLKKEDSQVVMAAQQEISDIKANAQAILLEKDLTEMRQDFRMVSENLYPFLKTIGYEGEKLYWQNCPMAFGEGKEANWLSNTKEIINPYLGKHDPQYKSAMLNCGEIKDTIK